MPWRVGMDEAGYGPNLGPFVLASSACRVPDGIGPCLWEALAPIVRRKKDDDERLLIDDSKKVNEGKNGLQSLERGVMAVLGACQESQPTSVRDYLELVANGTSADDLYSEPWFDPDESLPIEDDPAESTASEFAEECRDRGIEWGPIRSVIVPAARFNQIVDQWGVKSGVTGGAVCALLREALELPGSDTIQIAIDKLGGRNFYAPLLNEAFPNGWVRVVREGPDLCEYEIDRLPREVRIRFEPRADGSHLNVALASMAAKYFREVCMAQFNRYWQDRVPGLKATAGYPVDAARFFLEIRPILDRDGIIVSDVWRKK